MREKTNEKNLKEFMRAFGNACRQPVHVYFTGGATAVLLGFRSTTIDMDVKFIPDHDEVYKLLPQMKEKFHINIELASPSDFIPALPGWQERCPFIVQFGNASFYHYDFYSQALSKIERGHKQDKLDVEGMLRRKLIKPKKLYELFKNIKPKLYRYPAIDPQTLERNVKEFVENFGRKKK